jgi:hypothetical protein
MNRLQRRLERLEQQTRAKPGAPLIYLMPNLEEGEGQETPYSVKISSELWAHAFGAPLTEDDIRELRVEYGDERSGSEPKTKN